MAGTSGSTGIVVGLDGSQQSKDALRWAVRQAKKQGTTVRAIAAWHHPVQFGYPRVFPDRELEEQAQKWLDDAVADVAKDEPDCEVATVIERGHPPRVLLDASDQAEMLVLGHRGRGGVAGMLLGSVVLQCVQHANCPVVVIR